MRALIVVWLISAMSSWLPIPKQWTDETAEQYVKRVGETKEAAEARRLELAEAIVRVSFDPQESPLFGGEKGRLMTALFINAIMSFEGGYHRLVHNGTWRGDSGASWCQMQINIGAGKTVEGWTGKELIADSEKCIRAGLHILKESVRFCSASPYNFTWEKDGPDIFSVYMSGKCIKGSLAARNRWNRALSFFRENPISPSDFVE